MESKTHVPSFTVSLRGYDRLEVDEYLDSLAEALGQLEQAEQENGRLRGTVARLGARVEELEQRISSDTPRSGAVLGEKIGMLLRNAEETAGEVVAKAEDDARRTEASARAEAAQIVAEAESRASARTRQIEQWAEQVVSHTRAEEARMLREQEDRRRAAMAELQALADQRQAVAATLAEVRQQLGQALALVTAGRETGQDDDTEVGPDSPSASDGHERLESGSGESGSGESGSGESGLAGPDSDDFDAKLEAWVSKGSEPRPG